jgi:hypothetical protein
MNKPAIVFGMNTMFAVRQFLPETLAMVQERGYRAIVISPETGGDIPGVEFYCVPMRREIAPLSDLVALFRLWTLLRSLRPAVVNVSTPKMALLGGIAARLARVPHRIYTLIPPPASDRVRARLRGLRAPRDLHQPQRARRGGTRRHRSRRESNCPRRTGQRRHLVPQPLAHP